MYQLPGAPWIGEGSTREATARALGDGSASPVQEVAQTFEELGQHLEAKSAPDTMEAVTAVAVDRIDRVSAASITLLRGDRFTTMAATDDLARRADALQYALQSGPCVDAVVDGTLFVTGDIAVDPRWPEFGPRVHAELGICSMLAYRLSLEVDGTLGGLNLYSTRPDAFGDEAVAVGFLLAAHGALAVNAALNRERAEQLQQALESNRDIGVALGVLMAERKVTRERAFDLLRLASQHGNRKLHEIALQVAETGELPPTPVGKSSASPPPIAR